MTIKQIQEETDKLFEERFGEGFKLVEYQLSESDFILDKENIKSFISSRQQVLIDFLTKEEVEITWDTFMDEIYDFFGECNCGYDAITKNSKFCGGCGRKIKNTY